MSAMTDYDRDIYSMTADELVEYIAELKAEVNSASCAKCARNKLNGKVGSATRQLTRVKRAAIIAAERAALSGETTTP